MALEQKTGPGLDTISLHGGQTPDPTTTARAVPIYQTSSYVFHDTDHAARLFGLQEFGNIYSRIMNPTTDVLEKRIAELEGGSGAVALASGQAAITLSILNIARAGDEIISANSLYGGTYNLFHYTLPKLGINVKFVDPSDPDNFRRAITPNTKAIYAETVGNPKLDTFDISSAADVAHAAGIPVIIDNTLPTPYLIRPFEWGADVVIHSLTKFIGGHGTSIGGIVVDSGKFDWSNGNFPEFTEPDPSYHGLKYWDVFGDFPGLGNVAYIIKLRVQLLRDFGPTLAPLNSFLLLQGLETLPLRMARHSENALAVAKYLEGHPKVNWVLYPGLESHPNHPVARNYHSGGNYGGILGFGIKGGREEGKKFIDSLKLFSLLANVGDAKSLAIHPATTTHAQLTIEEQITTGVTDDFVRLSIGLENIDDIIADLKQGLASI